MKTQYYLVTCWECTHSFMRSAHLCACVCVCVRVRVRCIKIYRLMGRYQVPRRARRSRGHHPPARGAAAATVPTAPSIKLNDMRLFRWERALDLAVQHKHSSSTSSRRCSTGAATSTSMALRRRTAPSSRRRRCSTRCRSSTRTTTSRRTRPRTGKGQGGAGWVVRE